MNGWMSDRNVREQLCGEGEVNKKQNHSLEFAVNSAVADESMNCIIIIIVVVSGVPNSNKINLR